jgi:hypothetical protein
MEHSSGKAVLLISVGAVATTRQCSYDRILVRVLLDVGKNFSSERLLGKSWELIGTVDAYTAWVGSLTGSRLVATCQSLSADLPIIHIADWKKGAFLSVKDPPLLMALRESGLILVSFDLGIGRIASSISPGRSLVPFS